MYPENVIFNNKTAFFSGFPDQCFSRNNNTAAGQCFCLHFFVWDISILKLLLFTEEIDNFRDDLTDDSVETMTLLQTNVSVLIYFLDVLIL